MIDTKHFQRDPAKGSRSLIEKELQHTVGNKPAEYGGVPEETFPPFNDPAFSATPAEPPPTDPTAHRQPPVDSEYAGHPDFSQDAATNRLPPDGMGNSEPVDDTDEKTRHSDGQRETRSTVDPSADDPR